MVAYGKTYATDLGHKTSWLIMDIKILSMIFLPCTTLPDLVRNKPDSALPMQRFDEYSPARGINNTAYHTDYHSDYRPSELVYDPRNRSKNDNTSRRRPSIEMAYSSGGDTSDYETGKHTKRHT